MKDIRKITISAMFVALTVAMSGFSIPIGIMKCYPIQHFINVISAVILGPGYGVVIAFIVSLIRNLMGTGSLLAFPGSMAGALICGLVYKYTKKYVFTYIAEIIGTGIIGGIIAYPVALFFMSKEVAVYAFIVPFIISTTGGTIIAAILISVLEKSKLMDYMKHSLEEKKA